MNQEVMHSAESIDTLGLSQICDTMMVSGVERRASVCEISPEEMFGHRSQLSECVEPILSSQTLVGDGFFQVLVVVMMLVVIFFAARHRHRIGAMFGRVLKGHLSEDYSSGRRDEMLTRTFLHASSLIGVMLIVIFMVKYAPMWLPSSLTPPAKWVSALTALYVLIVVALVIAFEHAVLWIIGKVTRNEEVIGAILYMKRAGFSLAAIAISPVFLLGVLSSEKITDAWNILLIVECALLVLLFIKETLAFFIDKKIPIFHWILYLCTVEAFPLSLIWALTMRS